MKNTCVGIGTYLNSKSKKRKTDHLGVLGYVKDFSNTTSDMGVDIFCAEFHADFRSGLLFDLRGCISEHKSNF